MVDPGDPLVAFLGNSLQIDDEIYQISDFDYRGSRVLLRLEPSSVDLSKTGVHQRFYGWPIAWTRFYGEGRVGPSQRANQRPLRITSTAP